MRLSRREFLVGAGALALAPAAALRSMAEPEGGPAGESFSFAHFTDIHIEPELKAAVGTAVCFDRINSLRPEFALCGGDLVFDSNAVPRRRGIEVFDLYAQTSRRLAMPVHSVPGNHDVFGLSNQSGVAASDPLYGKKMFEDRIGPRYSAFAYKGWHFLLLDSIGITPQREFIGRIDEEQLAWLRTQLAAIGPSQPIIVLTHIPLLSAVLQIVPDPWKSPSTYLVTNAPEVLGILAPYRVKAVLQGHTHIRENVIYNGCQFLTSGAVCGNWWKGPRCGHPEGFAMVTVKGGEVSWRYETYGFVAAGA
jgi:3',5'-cyclic AMP phosphodiesterase CpdA